MVGNTTSRPQLGSIAPVARNSSQWATADCGSCWSQVRHASLHSASKMRKPTPTTRVNASAKICAPRIGRVRRSTATLRRRNCARHQRMPAGPGRAVAIVAVRARWKALATNARSLHARHVARCARSSEDAPAGHWPFATSSRTSISSGRKSASRFLPYGCCLRAEEGCDFATRAKQKQANACRGEPGDRSNLAMGIALGVGQPKQLALPGLHLAQSQAEHDLRVRLPCAVVSGEKLLGNLFDRCRAGAAPVVAESSWSRCERGRDGQRLHHRMPLMGRWLRRGSGRSSPA